MDLWEKLIVVELEKPYCVHCGLADVTIDVPAMLPPPQTLPSFLVFLPLLLHRFSRSDQNRRSDQLKGPLKKLESCL